MNKTTISIRDLRSRYWDSCSNFVLEKSGYLKLLPRKARGYRYYEVLKPLPDEVEYQCLKVSTYTSSMIDLFQKFLYEYELLMEKSRKYSKSFPDTHEHIHEISNNEILEVLERHFEPIKSSIFKLLDKDFYRQFFNTMHIYREPSFDYSVSEIGRTPSRNELLNELCSIVDRLNRLSNGVMFGFSEYKSTMSVLMDFRMEIMNRGLKFTAFGKK